MPGQTFTGDALVEALRSGELDQPAGVVLTGMVKESEQPEHVAFARGGCDTWIDVPTSLIERAEHVGARPCEDHSHPVFRITAQPHPSHVHRSGPFGPRPRRGISRRMAQQPVFHDYCMYGCDWLVRECISLGGSWESCINLRVICSDICGIFSDVYEPIFE